MKIAIAALAPEPTTQVSMRASRAPYYLIFNHHGVFLEALANPFLQLTEQAAPKLAALLANEGVSMLVAGEGGAKLLHALEAQNIVFEQSAGIAEQIARELA